MSSSEDIQQQQDRLVAHRRTLAHYLKQEAALGSTQTQPGTSHGIREAREHIARIKAVLRGWGVEVEDYPDDDQPDDMHQSGIPPIPSPPHTLGDQIDAQKSQGFINCPAGSVSQHFGDTVSGDKISGNITVADITGTGIAIGRDNINTSDIKGTGIAIGHGATSIVTIYQQVLRPVPIMHSAGVRRMVEDYAAIFGGRDTELATLDAFLTQDERPFGLLIAPTGRGKTALLIHWIARVRQQHPSWRVAFVPISIRYQTAGEQVALSILAHTLAEIHHDLEQFRTYDQSFANLRAMVGDYLRRPLPDDTRLLIVLDGLDEAVGWQVSRDLFPRTPGPNLKLVVAARDMAHRTRATWYHDLGFERRLTCDLFLEGLNQASVQDILRQMGNPLDQLATDVDVLAEIERVSQGDPVTIRLLIELLQAEEISPGQLAHLPPDNLNSVMDLWLENLRQHEREHERVSAFLSLVATAYGPLMTEDVLHLDGHHLREPRDVEDAARAVARFVIGCGTTEQGYVFSHRRLREVYREQRLGAMLPTIQQQFVEYGKEWYTDRSTPLPDYLRQFWVSHLQEAGEWDTLRTVLTEIVPSGEHWQQPWASARYRAEGSYAGYLSDLDVLWQWANAQQDIALGVRCALIYASIRSLSGKLSPELLVGLVTVGTPEGKWSAAAALEHVRQMPGDQKYCFEALLEHDCITNYDTALDVARTLHVSDIHDELHQIEAIVSLATFFSPDEQRTILEEALALARKVPEPFDRILGLISLFKEHLPAFRPEERLKIAEEALSIACSIDEWNDDTRHDRGMAFMSLACYIPLELGARFCREADQLTDSANKAQVFIELAKRLPPGKNAPILYKAFRICLNIDSPSLRANMLAEIVPDIPNPGLPLVLHETLIAARNYLQKQKEDLYPCERIIENLRTIVPFLHPTEQQEVLDEALAAARNIGSSSAYVKELVKLAPYYQLPEQHYIYVEILETVNQAAGRQNGSSMLAEVIPILPSAFIPFVLLVAANTIDHYSCNPPLVAIARCMPADVRSCLLTKVVRECTDTSQFSFLIGNIASLLSSDLLDEALEKTRAIDDEHYRARALTALAQHLPFSEQATVYAEALAASRIIDDASPQCVLLSKLYNALPPDSSKHDLFQQIIAAAQSETYPPARAQLLGNLAKYLPTTDEQRAMFQESLNAIRKTTYSDSIAIATSLEILASSLPEDMLEQAVNIAFTTVESKDSFNTALQAFAPRLSDDLLAKVLEKSHEIDQFHRIEVLEILAPYLPDKLLATTLDTIHELPQDIRVLEILAPYLPDKLLATTLDTIHELEGDDIRPLTICAIAPYLSPELLPRAFAIIRNDPDTHNQVSTLMRLAAFLPVEERTAVYSEAFVLTLSTADGIWKIITLAILAPQLPLDVLMHGLDKLYHIPDHETRCMGLTKFIPHLPSSDRLKVSEHALEAIQALPESEEFCVPLRLKELGPHLQPELIAEALRYVSELTDSEYRIEGLIALLPYVPLDERLTVCTEILHTLQELNTDMSKANALVDFASHLHPETYQTAFKIAKDLTDAEARAKALIALSRSSLFPSEDQVMVYTEILDAIFAIPSDNGKTEVLETIIPGLPENLFASTLHTILRIKDTKISAKMLALLAPELPPGLVREAFETVTSRHDTYSFDKLLLVLVHHLPSDILIPACEVVCTPERSSERTEVLSALASHLKTQAIHKTNRDDMLTAAIKIVRLISTKRRRELLVDLEALTPWLEALATPDELAAIAQSIVDVSRAWP